MRIAWLKLLLAAGLLALSLDTAVAEPVLSVSGNIEAVDGTGVATFDRDDLSRFSQHTIRTSTTWTEGVHEFRGVLLCDVLDAVGATGSVVEARAMNDYYVEIPAEDCRTYPVLLALEQDGAPLTLRDRGPIWIVYPRDDFSELNDSLIDARWVWQLRELIVR